MDEQLNDDSVNKQKDLRQFVYIVYILQALFFLTAVTPIFATIINLVKKDDLINSQYASHYRWQQNTFWYGLLWVVLFTIAPLTFILIPCLAIWYVYRIAKGWIYLADGKELYPS